MTAELLLPLAHHVRQLAETAELQPLTDRELLERFLDRKDQFAFTALVHRNGNLVLSACRQVLVDSADIEDAFQATFLVLLRKAAVVRWQPSLGSWLYGTAHRIALQARTNAVRRKQRESRAMTTAHGEAPMAELSWREAVDVLHEELDHLPDRYRLPLLLCYLEGKSRDETAEHLGVTTGAVKWRLERGRDLLRKRLMRRGITLSVGLLGTVVNSSAACAVPPRLVQATVMAASTGPRASVVALTTGVSTVMFSSKVQLVACLFLCLGVLLGVAGYRLSVPVHGTSHASTPPTQAPRKPPRKEVDNRTLRGRVLDPAGKPVAGANIFLLGDDRKLVQLGTSVADGRFTIKVPKDVQGAYLVVRLGNAGIDFLALGKVLSADSMDFRLVQDHVIRGRVLDTEGKPVAGVQVQANDLGVYPNNSLDSFLVTWKKRHFMSGLPAGVKHFWRKASALFTTKTDAQGRFVLRGAGAERLVHLHLTGGGIAHTSAWIVNRKGFDPKPYNEASRNNIPKGLEKFGTLWLLHGPSPSIVVEAGKTVRGVVKDVDTGKPRPHVEVMLTRTAGNRLLSFPLQATSDATGKYVIHGARRGKKYMVEVKSDLKTGHMACQVWANDTPGHQPVTIDIATKKGVVITGRVIDSTTGKAIPGFAMAAVLSSNRFAKRFPNFSSSAYFSTRKTGADGTFRVVTIPGQVLLMGGPDPRRIPGGYRATLKYKPPVGDPKYPQHFRKFGGHTAYITFSGSFSPIQGNFCKVLEIKPGATVVKQDIVLERAKVLKINLQDPAGEPLKGALVTGLNPKRDRPITCPTDSCLAYHIEPGQPRRMVFFHSGRKLVGTVVLKGNEKQPVVVKLGAVGVLKGRLLDLDGKPLAGVTVDLSYREREADEVHEVIHRARLVTTDRTGAFVIKDVIPQVKFVLTFRQGRQRYQQAPKPADPKVSVRPGQTWNLGTIRLQASTGE